MERPQECSSKPSNLVAYLLVTGISFVGFGVATAGAEEAGADQTVVEEVVVIGTRRSERSASDLAVLVDVISEQDLQVGNSLLQRRSRTHQ